MPRLSKIGAAALAAFGWTSGGGVTVDFLVVAGGGSGGVYYGGGGGAGGLLTGTTSIDPTLSYTVIVGAGAPAAVVTASGLAGNNGSSSQFGTLTAAVGGGAGGYVNVDSATTGGSGGGAGGSSSTVFSAKAGTSGQGNAGGTNGTISSPYPTGGGGGAGAGAVGANGAGSQSGAGGAGFEYPTSSGIYYAGGGGGGGTPPGSAAGAGGSGGGGAGSTGSANATSGTANTGGGGGGASNNAVGTASGKGGSGVVIISYPSPQKFGGGIVTTSGANTIHTFQTSGTLSPLSSLTANFLVVAGGGGGGAYNGGGGGAGGLRSSVTATGGGGSLESSLTIDTNSIYTVTVGGGGVGAIGSSSTAATSGGNSVFNAITSTGGGQGAFSGSPERAATTGGSGGGGANGGVTAGAAGTANQGRAGGNGQTSGFVSSGGGGGANTAGTNAPSSNVGGAGGAGVASLISGTSVTYAGGGGGGTETTGGTGGAGGAGGGGSGANGTTGGAGTANLGGGGGGSQGGSSTTGGAGGSGIVIISYASATQLMAGGTVTISGGNVIHTFTSSGYLTPIKLVGNSLRFRSSASAYLNRTPTVASNRKTWTWSGWVKRGALSGAPALFSAGTGTSVTDEFILAFSTGNTLFIGASNVADYSTTAVFRDPAAWYHIVLAVDTTQAVAANRTRLWVNNLQLTFDGNLYGTQNTDTPVNNTVAQNIGRRAVNGSNLFDGYLADVNFVDGQALTPNSFGTFNSFGVWQPIVYGGSYGTNGFYLPFTANTESYAGFFNGSGYSIDTTATQIVPATGDFTIEALVYFTNLTNYPVITSQGTLGTAGRFNFFVSDTGYINVGTNTAAAQTAAGVIVVNRWYYVAATRSGANTAIYVNGLLAASSSTTIGTVQNTTLKIGVDWGGDYTFGYISNVRVSNVVRTISPVTAPTTNFTNDASTILLTLQGATVVDNSSNAYALTNNGTVTLGKTYPFAYKVFNDQSPQGNNWTPNSISGITGTTLDYMTDVPTLTSTTAANYCVMNPLRIQNVNIAAGTLSDGNLKITTSASDDAYSNHYGTMAFPTTGKWYFETVFAGAFGNDAGNYAGITGVSNGSAACTIVVTSSTAIQKNFSNVQTGLTFSAGDILGVAFNATNLTVDFYKNGSAFGSQVTGLDSVEYTPFILASNPANTQSSWTLNFGQQPFAYTPPTDFLPLNTFNL